MRKINILILTVGLFASLQSCSQEYPQELKTGIFKTITESNTVKYMYRNTKYRYIYSDAHPGGNKLAKITWKSLRYELETINQTSDYDALIQTIVLNEVNGKNSFIETTYTEGSELKFTSEWTRVNGSPEEKLNEILIENGILKQ